MIARGTLWTLRGLVALGAAGALLTVWQSMHQRFAVDEVTYAHGAWAIAQGELPYRDFFFHHTPLLLQALAPLFALLGDDPGYILVLRWVMLLPLAVTVWACIRLNASPDPFTGRWEGWATGGFLLLVWPFVAHAIEIRPDNLALAFFLLALVLIPAGRGDPPMRRGAAAGFFLGAAVWTSEKALLYGCVFALGFLIDLVRWLRSRRGGGPSPALLLGHPLAFLGGFLVPVVTATLYLAATGSLDAFWQWGVTWNLEHEEHYPGHPWTLYFAPFFVDYWLFLPITVVGAAASLRALVRRSDPGTDPWSHRDLLLLPALITTLLSFTLQAAAYRYSLVPFLALFAIFTIRGLVVLLEVAAGSRLPGLRPLAALLAALLLGWTAFVAGSRLLAESRNDPQLADWRTLQRLTAPDDPVFDAAGRAVTRPHVSFFYFNDETVRLVIGERLSREITEGIRTTGCTVAWRDRQWVFLPEPLKELLYLHFQPMDETATFWVWGRPFERGEHGGGFRIAGQFLAVREGRYFVEPAEVLASGRLTVDGRAITEPIFALERGPHEVVYEGEASSFHILWLPRDGRRFRPVPGAERLLWPLRHRDPPRYEDDRPAEAPPGAVQ